MIRRVRRRAQEAWPGTPITSEVAHLNGIISTQLTAYT